VTGSTSGPGVAEGSVVTTYDGLLLDVGGVILDAWRALDAYAAAVGVTVSARGPGDPDGDPLWQAKLAGTLTLDGYWNRVAAQTGHDDWRTMFRTITDLVPDALFDADATALMRDARAAGRRVGVLSNDAYTIQSPAFFAGRPEFAGLHSFVDASDIGVSKPDPDAYLVAAEALGLAAERVVFLDDMPENVEGARAVGMGAVHVTPGNPLAAFAEARALLGLPI
jgi:putative hydrolase of the HAD superfamily